MRDTSMHDADARDTALRPPVGGDASDREPAVRRSDRARPVTHVGAAADVAAAPIVVAVDGGPGGDAALSLAYRLAGATGADVRVLTAVEPPVVLDAHLGAYMGAPTFPLDGTPWLQDARAAVDVQLARAGLAEAGWPVDVLLGEPARRIAAIVRDADARVVLLGRVRHRLVTERYGSRLALRLTRLTDAPVLSVAPSLTHLPRRVVVGVDFSPYATYAARIALSLAAPDAVVHLVHVRPRYDVPLQLTDVSREADDYTATLPAAWSGVLAELGDPGGRQLETVTISGEPSVALVEYARQAAADLVATGTHGRGFMDRLVLGSIAESLLQHAHCSVLCVPGSAVARAEHRRRAIAGMHTTSVPRGEWDAALAEVTRAAAGRPCVVEVDHREEGAQHLVEGLPFAGASHDRHGDRLVLTFGIARGAADGPDDLVLSHAVPGVRALDVVSDARGTVHVLRMAVDDGQTLLTFTA